MTVTKTFYGPPQFFDQQLVGATEYSSQLISCSVGPTLFRSAITYTANSSNGSVVCKLYGSPDDGAYSELTVLTSSAGVSTTFNLDFITSGIGYFGMTFQEVGDTGSAGYVAAGVMIAQADSIAELEAVAASTLTVPGDTLFADSAGTPVALNIGNNGEVLTVVSGKPAWAAAGGGSLPDLPSDVLLDASKPNQIVSLNGSGVGTTLTVADANDLLNGRVEYDFSSSTGFTLTNGSGTASITGGAARLQMPTNTQSMDAGRVSITRDLHTLVSPTKFKAAVRLLALTNGNVDTHIAFIVNTSGGATNELRVVVLPDGTVVVGYLGGSFTTLQTRASAVSWDAEHWLEVTMVGTNLLVRIGSGVAGQYPAQTSNTWRNIYSGNLFSYMQYGRPFDTIGLYLTTYGTGGGAITVDFDNLVIESA